MLGQIQSDLVGDSASLSATLRKSKVLASQLESDELSQWVAKELDGYESRDDLPDYRVLATSVAGTWTNGYYQVTNRALHLSSINDENLQNLLTEFPVYQGIRSVEEFAQMSDDKRFQVSADVTAYVNTFVSEAGYGYSQLHFTIGRHNFEQILDTVRNRLLDFVLRLDKRWNPEAPPPPTEAVRELVSVVIYNNPRGGDMSYFDQRGQSVGYQFNAAGNINIDGVGTVEQFAEQLAQLRSEISTAASAGAIPEEASVEAQHEVLEASRELNSEHPEPEIISSHLGRAKELLGDFQAAVSLVAVLAKAADLVSGLLT